jgi:hypothetical protein
VTELQARVAALDREVASRRDEVAELQAARTRLDVAGPTIEIIDTGAVRGSSAPQSYARELVGQVDAPAGLDSFTVGGKRQPVDEDGFFQVPLGDEGAVTLVAVDRQGKRAEVVHRAGRGPAAEPAPSREASARRTRGVEFGSYHALIIGNQDYSAWPDLDSAAPDARAVAELLEARYGFRTRLLLDATYFDVLVAFAALREELKADDNLLVYYAGHGEIDASTGMGYWLPVDAERDRKTAWLSSREISEQVSLLPSGHVLVVADSCYSATLTRSSVARAPSMPESELWLREASRQRSRTALTSGGIAPVLDKGGAGHSIFGRAILDLLAQNSDVLEARRVWLAVRTRVEFLTKKLGQPQVPEYAPIRFAGHESGEFFFVPVAG